MCNSNFPPPSPSSSSSPNSTNYFTRIRRPSLRSMAAAPSEWGPKPAAAVDEEPAAHFLSSCTLCAAPLRSGDDIYMYRGDAPFCSEECRQQQMDADEAKERSREKKNRNEKTMKSSEKVRIFGGDLDAYLDDICAGIAGTVVAG